MQTPKASKPQPARKDRFRSVLLGLAAALAAAVPTTSSAWTEIFPSSTIQIQDTDGDYHNQPGTSTSISYEDARFTKSGGTETFQVVGSLRQRRVERRYNDEYGSSVSRRWLADVLFNSPSSGVTIHQLFNGTVGPHVLITTSSSSGGSVRAYNLTSSSTQIASGVYGVTFKLESRNSSSGIQILINGSVKVSGSRRSGNYYTKYGLYNPNAAQSIRFSNIHIYR